MLFLGQIEILNQEVDGKHEPCLAFMIEKDYSNKGYATEGAIACVKYAFKSLKLDLEFPIGGRIIDRIYTDKREVESEYN